jgi:Phytanoyl-CoA dioxygenase (PhyH)
MDTIYFDSDVDENVRREYLYKGQLFVFSARASVVALCEFARELIQEAFQSIDPTEAQHHLPADQYVGILARLKPKFVHHPKSKQLLQRVLEELGCDLTKTYFDVPRLKSVTHGGQQRSGLTFAIHPHRDTWYSGPFCQLNWWLPVYPIGMNSALAFHPRYWKEPVRNGSSQFNHYRWNKYARKAAADDFEEYTQNQPHPEEPIELEPQVRVICPVGGVILFSGAQLHSAVPNTSGKTRFSIDFRTVHLDDVLAKSGAPNVDSAATGTTLRDFMRGTDLSRLPDDIISLYDDEPPADGELVFQPPSFEKPSA